MRTFEKYLSGPFLRQSICTWIILSLLKMLPNRPKRPTSHAWNRGGNLDKTRGGPVVLGSLVEEEWAVVDEKQQKKEKTGRELVLSTRWWRVPKTRWRWSLGSSRPHLGTRGWTLFWKKASVIYAHQNLGCLFPFFAMTRLSFDTWMMLLEDTFLNGGGY